MKTAKTKQEELETSPANLLHRNIVLAPTNAKICNASIYSCLCGSLQESVQEGKGEIIYQIRQHSYACQSLGNLVTIVFFQSC